LYNFGHEVEKGGGGALTLDICTIHTVRIAPVMLIKAFIAGFIFYTIVEFFQI
jgi:hypothetical protein